MAMWLFNKGKRQEIWDEDIPIGDIEAARRIRDICRAAADSAKKVAGFADRPDKNSKKNKYEADRYERAAKAAMEIAIKMSDDLLRDAAVRQIVNLCAQAGDFRTARILLRAIQAVSIREDVMNEHPMLRQ
jgi:hypothetical protein